MGRANKLAKYATAGSGAVPWWAYFLTVSFLIGGMGAGYLALNSNTNKIQSIINGINARSTQRDQELCDQAHINKALTPYVLPKQVRKYINKFLHDINAAANNSSHQPQCRPVLPGHDLKVTPKPHPTPSAPTARPTTTVTQMIITPSGTQTVVHTATPGPSPTRSRHHQSPKPSPSPTSVLCIIPPPSPAPRPGGCKWKL